MTDRDPMALMSGPELTSYCAFLLRLAGKRRGSVADRLRSAAQELSGAV